MDCPADSTLELSLKGEQLVLHTVRARAVKAMVELFLSELKKASVAGRLEGEAGRGAGGTDRVTRRLAAHPSARLPTRRTRATSLPCEATSRMTTASSASNGGTSSSCCQWPVWSQVAPGGGRAAGRGRAAGSSG